MASPFSHDPADYRCLGGTTRRYLDTTTGQTLSRRQYEQRFKLAGQGFRTFEEKALRRAGQAPGETARPATLDKFYRVVQRLVRGERLTKAARAEGTTPTTVWRLNQSRAIIGKSYTPGARGTHGAVDHYVVRYRGRATFWTRDGVRHDAVPLDEKNLRLVSRHSNAIKKALDTGDDRALRAFDTLLVYDLAGRTYQLLTNLDALYQIHEAQVDAAVDWDALFQSGEEVLHAA
jgi:hypothetical protein